MLKQSFKKFKIDPSSIVTGDQIGHLYCTTIPIHPDGMKLKDRNKRYIPVHRVIMENHLGRFINPEKEEINHKDDNPKNNNVSNLELVSHAEHARLHSKKKKFWKESPRNKTAKPSPLQVIRKYSNLKFK